MVDLTVYLNKKVQVDEAFQTSLEERLAEAIGEVFKKGVKVRLSRVGTNKPAELIFNDMSPVDIDDLEEIVDVAVDALIFAVNSLDGKKIGITIHPVIIYDVEGEIL